MSQQLANGYSQSVCMLMANYVQVHSAMRLMLDWLMGGYLMPMVEWRYVSMDCGVQCVMTGGMPEMHKWCVDN